MTFTDRIKPNKAIFMDRDGVINEMIYHHDHGILDSPFTLAQLLLFPWTTEAVKKLDKAGYKIVIVSNQPGIAKGHMCFKDFEEIKNEMTRQFEDEGLSLAGQYYCFHHPDAKIGDLRVICKCRKPEPGLILQAAKELDIDLAHSWMIGDGITDIQAGQSAGCSTILISKMKCDLCNLMGENGVNPDAIVENLLEAASVILGMEKKDEDFH